MGDSLAENSAKMGRKAPCGGRGGMCILAPSDTDGAGSHMSENAALTDEMRERLVLFSYWLAKPRAEDDEALGDYMNAQASVDIDALFAREAAPTKERDEALDRVDELEDAEEILSVEVEKDCWVAVRSLLQFVGHTGFSEGVSAQDACDLIADAIRDERAQSADLRLQLDAAVEGELRFVFHDFPSHEPAQFIEVETPDGRSVNAGEWRKRPDGLVELVVRRAAQLTEGKS